MSDALMTLPLSTIGARLAVLDAELEQQKPSSEPWQHCFDEWDTLVGRALAMQPANLKDAAVLSLCIADRLSELIDFEVPREDAVPVYEQIAKANAGILLAIQRAGLDLSRIGPGNADYEIRRLLGEGARQ